MHRSLPLMFRSLMYALRGGFLARPLVIALLLGTAGAVAAHARDLAGGERSEHGDQLRRSTQPHHDPLGRPRTAAVASV